MTDEMLNAMEKAYKMGCDEAREICNNYKIRIEKLEAALREIVDTARLVGDYYHVKIARKALEGKDSLV
jgi:hypothetical protein